MSVPAVVSSRRAMPVGALRAKARRLLLGLSVAALGTPVALADALTPAPHFVDLVDFPTNEANWDRFHALEDHLGAAFFKLCAIQVCASGRVLWPMQLRCSVRTRRSEVAACVWVVAGSDLQVRAVGSIKADVVVWRCALPIVTGVEVEHFHRTLDVDAPLQVVLPGASASLKQSLLDCLSRPGTPS